MERMEDKNTIRGLKVVLILAALFTGIALLFHLLYSLPLRDSFLWYFGVFFCFYIPGNLLLRSLDFNKGEYFVNFFHSIALGTALIPLVYSILRRLSHPELLYIFGIVMFLVWIIFTVKDFKEKKINIYTSYQDIISASVLIAVIFLLLHLSYFNDVIFLENGFKISHAYFTETEFHLGIINALRNFSPPLFPYASGTDFSHYHINMHLEIEMFNRLFSMDTLELTFFYFPLLYFCLLIFMPYMIVSKYMGTRFIGVLIGVLIFSSDLSFIPGLLAMLPADFPWVLLFNPTIWPLLTLNGYLPALFIMFLCILYLKEFYRNGKLSYLIVFAFLGFAAFGFKSSMGLHIMSVSFLTGMVITWVTKDKDKSKLLCAVSLLTLLVITIDVVLVRGGVGNNIIIVDLFNRFHNSLKILGISNMPWFLYPVCYVLYLFASFGVKVFGFLYIMKYMLQKKYFDPAIIFLIIFVISGFFLSEMIFIGYPSRYPNNAMWFLFQSLIAVLALLPYFLLKMQHNKKRFWGIIGLIILLSFPGTIQFLWLRSNPGYINVASNAMSVLRYLESIPPKSVTFHPLKDDLSVILTLSGRVSVLSFPNNITIGMIGINEATTRMADIESFFNPSAVIKRSAILEKYNVDYVLASPEDSKTLNKEPMLSQDFKNNEYVIYKVNRIN